MDNKSILNDENNGGINFPWEMMELTSVSSTSGGSEAGNNADQAIQTFLVDQNGSTGFGYLTKKYELQDDTVSREPSLTQEDMEKGQVQTDSNERYFLYKLN